MLLLLRAVLVLGLVTLVHGARTGQSVKAKSKKGAGVKGKMVRLVMHPSMVPQITSMSPSSIANMSLSPWTYRETYVESRLPQRIYHAECQTSGCLSLQGDGEDISLEAKPIYYQVLVLHRVRSQKRNSRGERRGKKKYSFRLATEMITVGCTCVRPSVVSHQ